MDIAEPRVRRRGFFFHVETLELDHIEQETAEGVPVRLRASRPRAEHPRISADSSHKPTHAVRSSVIEESTSEIRSANGIGSHRQGRMSR